VTGVSDGLYGFAFCDSESQMLCTNHVALGRKKTAVRSLRNVCIFRKTETLL